MNQPSLHSAPLFRGRHFVHTTIILCVRWYFTYKLSYRDLVEMMVERGVDVSHPTILRWMQRFVPEFEKRWNCDARQVGTSWRVDETYITATHAAITELKESGVRRRETKVRTSKYLNNLIEQDQRRVKQRTYPMRGFKRFANAAVTIC